MFLPKPAYPRCSEYPSSRCCKNPDDSNELSLFLYENYYPLSNEVAVYATEAEAQEAYYYYYGDVSEGRLE